jgi:hypothetical protein
MSTHGLIHFTADGVTSTAYVHWDGDSLGDDIRSWLKVARHTDLRGAIMSLTLVSDFGPNARRPTAAERKRLVKYEDSRVGGPEEEWYRLLRLCQGDPGKILESGYLYDGSDQTAGYEYFINADGRYYQEKRNGRKRAKVLFEDL